MSDAAPSAPTHIEIRRAREHNLAGFDLRIPRNRLVVITGLSGSGKSSLAFDTLYAEGQRRYVESLSAYARQFLERMHKPEVDAIDGLSPAIAIEQRAASRNPRSTVATATEIHDHLRLLFARVGQPHCWHCGKAISGQTVQQMTDRLLALEEGRRVQLLAPVIRDRKGAHRAELEALGRQGFVRVRVDGELHELSEPIELSRTRAHSIDVVVDRLAVRSEARARIAESIETALGLADGLVRVDVGPGEEEWLLSERSACVDCGVSFPEIAPRMFSFNGPHGACPECGGLGTRETFEPGLVVPDPSRSASGGAVAPWSGRQASRQHEKRLAAFIERFHVDPEVPWGSLPKRSRDGLLDELERRFEDGDEAERTALSPYRAVRTCDACEGSRLRVEARSVRLGEVSIDTVTRLSVEAALHFFEGIEIASERKPIAERILRELDVRLRFLMDVGLGYLTLDRPSTTLSGGEGQRIRLATQIGSSLVGVLYILDEPSIGLHPRDHQRLLTSLERLRDLGNSVLVVEHDEETIRMADHVIELGPGAGIHGGRIIAQGSPEEILADEHSLTGAYLSGRRGIPVPGKRRRPGPHSITLVGCREHNLKGVTLRVPLGLFLTVTGVSGSGKSSLVNDTLHPVLAARLHDARPTRARFERVTGVEHIDKVIDVDQAPIGRTPRSNPATYTGALDGIRQLFSQVPDARVRGYGPGRFSFNVKGGRCESCQGEGTLRIEMHFLPDLFILCDACAGRRFNRETLEIRYKGRSIADVLEMTVEEAAAFMENVPAVRRPLETLLEVGLGYIRLGQSATTLSGGEAQRVKLARELARKSTGRTLYLLDEPTTGLHFADVERLLSVLDRLVDRGNTVLVIEHHPDVIKHADHVIDMGPEGGERGGEIVAEGTPEEIARDPRSHTGRFLARHLAS